VQVLLERLLTELTAGDHVVLMSNGSFQGLPRLLEQALKTRTAS
jgi:UDP-N-acetylmuramate-alanine ligase